MANIRPGWHFDNDAKCQRIYNWSDFDMRMVENNVNPFPEINPEVPCEGCTYVPNSTYCKATGDCKGIIYVKKGG